MEQCNINDGTANKKKQTFFMQQYIKYFKNAASYNEFDSHDFVVIYWSSTSKHSARHLSNLKKTYSARHWNRKLTDLVFRFFLTDFKGF